MQSAIFHLERFEHFLQHAAELNRLYAPEDPVVDAMALGHDAWEERLSGEDADSKALLEQASAGRRSLHTIHRNFPQGDPLHEQCAYLLRAFVGLAPFPEANARTGWDYTAEVLHHAGHSLEATWDEGRQLATSLWMEIEQGDFTPEQIDARDDSFASLAEWFRDRIA